MFDLTANLALLELGKNILAVEVHNVNLTSSDFSFMPRVPSDPVPERMIQIALEP